MIRSKILNKTNIVNHGFFNRNNGFSKGIYKSLNCGRGSKDKKRVVLKNIKYVSKKMNSTTKSMVLMHQTHSNKVIQIKKKLWKKINF